MIGAVAGDIIGSIYKAKCETVEQMRLVNTLCALQVFESNGGCRSASETPVALHQPVRPTMANEDAVDGENLR